MQAGVLDYHRDHQTAQKHHCGIVHIAQAGLIGGHDAHQRVQDHRDHACDGQW